VYELTIVAAKKGIFEIFKGGVGVMLILLVTLIIIVFFLFYRLEETIVVLAPLSVFLSMFVVPYLSLSTVSFLDVIVCVSIGVFVFKYGIDPLLKFPFFLCVVMVGISYYFSNQYGYEKHWVMSMTKLLTSYVYPVVIFGCLNTKKRLHLYVKSMIVFAVLLVVYALFELVTNSNPIIEIGTKCSLFMDNVAYGEGMRFGVKRLQSFLHLFGAFGYTCSSIFLVLLYVRIYFPSEIDVPDFLLYILLGLLVVCILCTGTRSVYLAFVVGLGIFYKQFKKYAMLVLAVMPIALIVLSMSSFMMDIVGSFTDTQRVEGSNTDMREDQLGVTLYYWLQNPIFGNGPSYTFTTVKALDPAILGAESIWFVLLIEYGLFGCLAFLVTIIQPVRYLIKRNLKPISFIVLMFFVNKSLSSVPGISEGYFFIYIVYFLKLYECSVKDKLINYLQVNRIKN
jgi:hypothetical protein